MSRCTLSHPTRILSGKIRLPASKSVSNRLLIIRALTPELVALGNLSEAEDTTVMNALLEKSKQQTGGEETYDCGPAGTTMRFLTAYFATQPGVRILTGSERMKKRPIKILVDALRTLGAKIDYLGEEGFAPLRVEGGPLRGGEVEIDGSVSSQFVSALLMIAPVLHNGLVIRFRGEVTSRPYINMTMQIMEKFSVYPIWQEDGISVSSQPYCASCEDITGIEAEPDWSAASYWYAMVALADKADILLEGLRSESLQGDRVTAHLFEFYGVHTEFTDEGAQLKKLPLPSKSFAFDFDDTPDIVQTFAVTAAGLRVPSLFRGVSTLKIKETDRIAALISELSKINVQSSEPEPDNFEVTGFPDQFPEEVTFDSYEDHRMAMALAPLALVTKQITIRHPEVVRKSYPKFWEQLKAVGFTVDI